MKNKKIIMSLATMIFLLIGGYLICIRGVGDKIVVEKSVLLSNKYELYKEIKDRKEVKRTNDILKTIHWENAKVSMVHQPDYQFHFENAKGKLNGTGYGLWIRPDKDKIELVVFNETKYVQLDKEKSEELFKIITGKSLSEEK